MKQSTLTVRDLLLPGEPLDPAEVLAGHQNLSNPVSWVVSLRPYPPAFPRLRGGELALVPTEHLARLDPPTTLSDVVRHLASRDAAGAAVRGEVDDEGRQAAHNAGLPLLQLHSDAQLTDIEQAIMRECALYQARREMAPDDDPYTWLGEALEGRMDATVQAAALASGFSFTDRYLIGAVVAQGDVELVSRDLERLLGPQPRRDGIVIRIHAGYVLAIAPTQARTTLEAALLRSGHGSGLSSERPIAELATSLQEATLAAIASEQFNARQPTSYISLGADRIILTLKRDNPAELEAFVEATLGPLLRHDAQSSSPLLLTVHSFVEHGGRLRETAAQIFVHRNTLAYRLDRAAEILGCDLKDPKSRLAVELALRALPLINS